jgi:hypothetical protein
MKKVIIAGAALAIFWSCADTNINVKKQTFPYTEVSGEYSVALELTGAATASDHQHILIYNTASGLDSLWIEDRDFFDSKVEVKWDGSHLFAVTNGNDLAHGEIVNITGTVFPEQDSVHVEWRYLQGTGDPNDDYVVTADGSLYNGLKN